MKFENIVIKTEKFVSRDVISSSEEPTQQPTQPVAPTQANDPYAADKW